ncbi:MAG: helix-turn-helix domain-containing protein, partial [Thermodesulfobacteriota bacterium]|nr:helix-turn-helix domain-containing protein [Thermodesulfobacteriota bacterium]
IILPEYSTMRNKFFTIRDLEMANVNAVMRAANILQALAEGPEHITILSGKTGLSVCTLHRLLKTLEKSGFAIQDPLVF